MQPTLFKPIAIPPQFYCKTKFPLVNLSDSFVEGSCRKKHCTVSSKTGRYESYKPRKSSFAAADGQLTKKNLNAKGFGFLSSEDKDERVYYWIETIKETSRYPFPFTY